MKLKIIKENFDKAMNEVSPDSTREQEATRQQLLKKIREWYIQGFEIYLDELLARVQNSEMGMIMNDITALDPKQFAMSLENQKIDLDPKL